MRWIAVFVLMLIGNSADACQTNRARSVLDLWYADAVVIGYVTNYKLIEAQSGSVSHGQFTINVTHTLIGQIDQLTTANWGDHVFGIPEVWNKQGLFLFGLKFANDLSREDIFRSGFNLWQISENTPVILQRFCGAAYIYEVDTRVGTAVALFGFGFLFFLKLIVFRHTWNRPEKDHNAYVKPRKRWGERQLRKT